MSEVKDMKEDATLPSLVEVIRNCEVVFIPAAQATVAQIEKDIIRTMSELLDLDPDDKGRSRDTYERLTRLDRLRTVRIGRSDAWFSELINVILRRRLPSLKERRT